VQKKRSARVNDLSMEWPLWILVVPIGLTSISSVFVDLMTQVFHEYLNSFIVVFNEGISIYLINIVEHNNHLDIVTEVSERKEDCLPNSWRVDFSCSSVLLGSNCEPEQIRGCLS
jgi:hypothetical protein